MSKEGKREAKIRPQDKSYISRSSVSILSSSDTLKSTGSLPSYSSSSNSFLLSPPMSYISSPMETFVIKGVRDNWQDHSYHHRYLDAMASIFAVQSPVAAITYFPKTQKFYLSYNADPTPLTKKKIDIIQKYLNDHNYNQVKSLLFLYIAYNNDFRDALSDDYNIFDYTDVYKYNIPVSDFGAISAEIEMRDHEFSTRLKASALKRQNLDKIEQKVKEALSCLVHTTKDINAPKKSIIDPEQIELLKSKIESGEDTSRNNQFLVTLYDNTIDNYNTLLKLLSDREIRAEDKSEDFFNFARVLLRPLQDVEKVLYYLNPDHETVKLLLSQAFFKYCGETSVSNIAVPIRLITEYANLGLRNVEITTIANDILELSKTKHAESNLGKEFSYESLYIGVSRLCCGICDHLLNTKYHHEHRGTHGTCDPKWGAPTIQFQGLFEELHQQCTGINQANRDAQLSQQHRKLSHDNLQALFTGVDVQVHNFEFQGYKDILLAEEDDLNEPFLSSSSSLDLSSYSQDDFACKAIDLPLPDLAIEFPDSSDNLSSLESISHYFDDIHAKLLSMPYPCDFDITGKLPSDNDNPCLAPRDLIGDL